MPFRILDSFYLFIYAISFRVFVRNCEYSVVLRTVHTDFDQSVVAKTSSRNLCLFFDKFVPGGQNGSLAVIGRIVITPASST